MTGIIPTLDQIDELHRRISPSQAAYDLIHTHCVIVAQIACQLARRQNALFVRRCTLPRDPESNTPDCSQVPPTDGVIGGTVPPRLLDEHLVMIGGLLHDIGTYKVLKHDGSDGEPLKFSGKHYIQHGLLGYEYLLEQGIDESIAQFARNHTGVGLTKDEVIRQELPLPPADYVPVNLEQETVMVADKFHSKSTPPKFLSVDAYTAKAGRFGEENQRKWLELVERYGRPDIAAMAERYHMRMV
ncbi:phosphohydrolase [Bifidobacterium hapali]|uniref:Phosphohydrolase n=1 Tax=Bifidobacterium hapali TaxID=1630172 RepID=A0A261FVU0_9BIFI|nr:HD domain-containing protein [Bifidobacterium hapali]OZG63289.1 phosphohydrolase [Bifidobacterium hapali]